MTKYKFNQSLSIKGKDFPQGVHEVDGERELHPHFIRYVGLGLIEAAPKVRLPEPVKSLQEKNRKLHDKLVKEADAKKIAKAEKEEATKKAQDEADAARKAEKPKEKEAEPVAEKAAEPVSEAKEPEAEHESKKPTSKKSR